MAHAVTTTMNTFGRLDVLLNCAGTTGAICPLAAYSLEEWRRVMDISLTGVFLCCRAVAPCMQQQNYERIVSLASIAGKEGNAGQSADSVIELLQGDCACSARKSRPCCWSCVALKTTGLPSPSGMASCQPQR